jgi:putative transposase
MAESFVDTYKTELIADRVWATRAQLGLAIVAWVGWFNTTRLHEALGDVPSVEFELEHALARPSAPTTQPSCQPSNPVSVKPGPAQGGGLRFPFGGSVAEYVPIDRAGLVD